MATAEQILDDLHRIREANHENNQRLSVSDRLRLLHERVALVKSEFQIDLPLAGSVSAEAPPLDVNMRSDRGPATGAGSRPKRASGGSTR